MQIRLTGSGLGLAVAAVLFTLAGVALGYTDLAVLAMAAALALGGATALLISRPTLTVERDIEPERVPRGNVALGLVTVQNDGRGVLTHLGAVDQVGGSVVQVQLDDLAPGAHTRRTYRLPTSRRGVYSVGPLAVSRVDPLGLVRVTRSIGDVRTLYVHPRVVPLATQPPGRRRSLDGPTAEGAPRGSITFHALREYVIGDDLRHVHWRSSARTGTLMVREHVDTSQTTTTVLLDCTQGTYDDDGFEVAVEVAASVCTAAALIHFPVRLLTTTGEAIGGAKAGHDPKALLDALSAVARGPGRSLQDLYGELAHGALSDSLVVVTGAVTVADLTAVARMKRRFSRVTIVSARPDAHRSPSPAHPAVLVIDAVEATDFAVAWERATR